MPFFESTVLLISIFFVTTVLGIGPVLTCLPKIIRRYSLFVAPTTGYVLFCFFSIWGSGLFNTPILHSNWWTFTGLLLWSFTASIFYRHQLVEILRSGKWILALLGLMILIVFFPALHQGVNQYLGTVNPDFYQSLSFQETLTRFNIPFWTQRQNLLLQGPFLEMFPDAFQARFGGVVFSVFVQQLTFIPARAALIISIMTFLSCLPLAVYFFSKAVLEFQQKTALLAAILIIISAPISMSFIHAFMGQNSALATFPLSISLAYIALRERSLSLAALTALILNGMFWLYVMALPYVILPIGLFAFLRCFKQKDWGNAQWLLFTLLIVIAISLIIHGSVFDISLKFVNDLRDLLSKVTQTIYYLDFLNEAVLQYATGLSSYPVTHSLWMYLNWNNNIEVFLLVIAILLSFLCLTSIFLWAKTASREAIILVLCLLMTYISVWVYYTFVNRYGYASFKMISWLQFIAVPFFAWGIIFLWKKIPNLTSQSKKGVSYTALIILGPIYISFNLLSDFDYIIKSYGHDRYHGTLINSFGVSNNNDYPLLTSVLKEKVPQGSIIATGFSDQIQNAWAAYYIDKAGDKVRILSHEEIPFEDAYLPNITSRQYIDSLGNTQSDVRKFFYDGTADYYLLSGQENLNNDIISNTILAAPLWSNQTFALYKKEDLKDLIITGRGFYRLEHMDPHKHDWWWPEAFRWTAEGGELYHLFPSEPQKPYQIRLSTIVGLGLEKGYRTLEFWLNNKKFDEIVVSGAAKITSKAYFPTAGINRITIRIKEKAELPAGHYGLWNRDLPKRSRQINLLISDICIIKNKTNHLDWPLNQVIEIKSLFALIEGFNGFDIDGWLRDKAELSLALPPHAKTIVFKFLAPGNLNFTFPYKLRIALNGISHQISLPTAGEHEISLSLAKIMNPATLDIKIYPSEIKQRANGIEQREVLQSIRLSSLKFLSK